MCSMKQYMLAIITSFKENNANKNIPRKLTTRKKFKFK